jgi:hypothetical protein
MTEAEWLEANSQFLASAIASLRSLLRSHGPIPRPSGPPTTEPQPERRFWNIGRRVALPALPPQPLIAAAPGDPMQERSGSNATPALTMLAQRLSLSEFERNVLLLCAAVDLDPSIAGLCAQAQGDPSRAFPTFALAMMLFKDPSWDAMSPERPLRRWRLIEISQPGATPLTVSALRADERIVNYLKV